MRKNTKKLSRSKQKKVLKAMARRKKVKRMINIVSAEKKRLKKGTQKGFSIKFSKSKKFKKSPKKKDAGN